MPVRMDRQTDRQMDMISNKDPSPPTSASSKIVLAVDLLDLLDLTKTTHHQPIPDKKMLKIQPGHKEDNI